MKLYKNYLEFLKALNKNNIVWCLIKDSQFLIKNGYDNEIDITAESKNRRKLRRIGVKLGWHESTLNNLNTHLIFWKFEKDKPFRIDIHLGRVLATAVPWLKSKDILADRIKIGDIWCASPKWELAVLLLSSLRGRKPKAHRIKRAKELKRFTNETKQVLIQHLVPSEFDYFYDCLIKGKIVVLSKWKRFGLKNIIREAILHLLLFATRLFRLSPMIILTCKNDECRNSVYESLIEKLKKSKINVKFDRVNKKIGIYSLALFLKRILSDVVVVNSKILIKEDKNVFEINPKIKINDNVINIIKKLYY